MLLVREIRLPINEPKETAFAQAMKKAEVKRSDVLNADIHKISVDARRGMPQFVYTVALEIADESRYTPPVKSERAVQVLNPQPFTLVNGKAPLNGDIVVCGCGPAGLFAALELAQAGYHPIVLERGSAMEERTALVEHFNANGRLHGDTNIQFGEGGAGTFSDGKLTTRIHDPLCSRVIQRFAQAGAPAEITRQAKPHIGTDELRAVFVTMRKQLLQMGGKVLFNTRLVGVIQTNGKITGVQTNQGDINCEVLVLAIGHSARDTFTSLYNNGISLLGKDFSVGYRIEHLQATIDKGLYHEAAGHPILPPGEYNLNARIGNRGVYTFCMCPGGSVVAAASEHGGVVTNGMSLHARNGLNANSAIVAGVSSAQDFGGDPFKAIQFQQALEAAAYKAGGGNYVAPAETLDSFFKGEGKLNLQRVKPTYSRGVQPANIGELLPADISTAIRGALQRFGKKLPGFDAPDAVLTGVETRTSSPLRIPRKENYESIDLQGLYPCGEGAGYAGGIMSAATDGIRVAKSIAEKYAPTR